MNAESNAQTKAPTEPTANDQALADPQRDDQEQYDEYVANIAHSIADIANHLTDYVGPEADMNGEIRESEFLVPFLTSKVLGMLCWASNKTVDDSVASARGLAARGERLRRRFNGSEVDDLALQENNFRVGQRMHQIRVAKAFQEAAKTVYAEQTGRDYGIAQTNPNAAQSMAAMEAAALAKHLGADSKDAAAAQQPKGYDRRPAIWKDPASGERYALNSEGVYEPIG